MSRTREWLIVLGIASIFGAASALIGIPDVIFLVGLSYVLGWRSGRTAPRPPKPFRRLPEWANEVQPYKRKPSSAQIDGPLAEWIRNPPRMVVCGTCGNKRCPGVNGHPCTGSNARGQTGSNFA